MALPAWRVAAIAAGLATLVAVVPAAAGEKVEVVVTARDLALDRATIEVDPGVELSITLENAGQAPHNIALYLGEGGPPLADDAVGEVVPGGASTRLSFVTPGPWARRTRTA